MSELTVHRLRVTLLDVSPPVWRVVRVPSSVPLSVLHHVVQIAMGWQDSHLHEWHIDEVDYGPPDEESWGDELLDESATLLADVAPSDSAFRYDYDFGDGWEHLVEVESVDPYDATVVPLVCLDGARACPPEDCGGPIGYEHLLDALTDPDDPEHEELTLWVGEGWNPAELDLQSTNNRLTELWRPS
ncbi:MAG: plasmid pRiA4b ORF-3 family protein [Actinomycetota bacterium]|nr:plasmid pRiA4b ORF-3 family protein [Actinomycetota bacterium]